MIITYFAFPFREFPIPQHLSCQLKQCQYATVYTIYKYDCNLNSYRKSECQANIIHKIQKSKQNALEGTTVRKQRNASWYHFPHDKIHFTTILFNLKYRKDKHSQIILFVHGPITANKKIVIRSNIGWGFFFLPFLNLWPKRTEHCENVVLISETPNLYMNISTLFWPKAQRGLDFIFI